MIDRSKLAFFSGDKIDKIIGVHEGSISVGAPTSLQGFLSSSDVFFHEFGDSAYFQGIFSSDGGTTWNDFGAQTPFVGAFPLPAFQTLDCNAKVTTTQLIVKATSWYDSGNSRSSSYTLQYKVALIAKNSMAQPVNPLPTNEKLSLLTSFNYQKIALPGTASFLVASGSSQTKSVTHGLGYFPKVRGWWFDASDPATCQPLVPDATGILYVQPEVRIGTNDVTFVVDATGSSGVATNGNLEYRIYYDR